MNSETSPFFLSPIDDAVPRLYKVDIFFFPSTNAGKEYLFSTLRSNLEKTVELGLLLKGNIDIIPTATQLGTQAITGPFRGIDEQIVVHDPTLQARYNHEDHRARHFPMQEMHLETFLPGIIPFMESGRAGQTHPVSLALVTFIKGGFAIAFAMAHAFIDGQAAQGLIELWAAFCRGEGEEYPVPQTPPPMVEMSIEPPLYVAKQEGARRDIPLVKSLFFIAKCRVQDLKAFIAPTTKPSQPHTSTEQAPYISTNDAVAALLWTSIISIRRSLETLDPDTTTSTFGLAISFHHFLPFLDSSTPYLANLNLILPITAPLSSLTTSQHDLQATALRIRSAILTFSAEIVLKAAMTLIDAPHVRDMIPRFVASANQVGLASLAKEGYYDLCWGEEV